MRSSNNQSTVESLVVRVDFGDCRRIQRQFLERSLDVGCSADGQLPMESRNDVEAAQVDSVRQTLVCPSTFKVGEWEQHEL